MKKTGLRFISLLCAVVLLVGVMPTPVYAARSLTEINEDIKAQEKKLNELEAAIEANKNNKAEYERLLAEFEVEYNKALEYVDEKEAEIYNTEADLDEKIAQLGDTIDNIQKNKDLYHERLIAIADINSSGALMATLLSVNSFSEFIQATDAIKRISARDTEILQEQATQREKFKKQQAELEDTIASLSEQLEELEGQRDYFLTKVNEMRSSIDNANWAITQSEQEYEATEELAAELRAEYNKVLAEQYKKGSQKGDGSVRYDGPLLMPVPGYGRISSYYGDPRSNTRGHYGVDFPAPEGVAIVAAAPGIIITAEWHYSYGWYIVIDHGDGLRTLYAHCVQLWKGVGDVVAQGDSIAGIGNTGNSFGAHLHFEVHDGGVRQNPLGSGYLTV